MIIRFYPRKALSVRNSIHTYLDRFPIMFTHNGIQSLCRWALHSHLSFPILAGQAVHACLDSENSSPDRFVLHFQTRIDILWIQKSKLSGQGREGKAYPHKVCPDRNRIRLRVNGALEGSALLLIM